MNSVYLTGNLTRDPEMRYTPTGTAVANLTVANNRRWKDPNSNDWKEKASFIGVVAFGKTAENIGEKFRKGSPILVRGRIEQEEWEDKQTQQKRSKTVVVCEEFECLARREDTGGAPPPRTQSAPPAARPGAKPPPPKDPENPDDDDVPFRSIPAGRISRQMFGVNYKLA